MSLTEFLSSAAIIRDATEEHENTAMRVGGLIVDILLRLSEMLPSAIISGNAIQCRALDDNLFLTFTSRQPDGSDKLLTVTLPCATASACGLLSPSFFNRLTKGMLYLGDAYINDTSKGCVLDVSEPNVFYTTRNIGNFYPRGYTGTPRQDIEDPNASIYVPNKGLSIITWDGSTWRHYPYLPIIDNLVSTDNNTALSANQGRILKSMVDAETKRATEVENNLLKKLKEFYGTTILTINGIELSLGDSINIEGGEGGGITYHYDTDTKTLTI